MVVLSGCGVDNSRADGAVGTVSPVSLASPVSVGLASAPVTSTVERSFVFGAGGDLGANEMTSAGLTSLDGSRARFFLALGDLDYDQTSSDAAWCEYVKTHLPRQGASFPMQLVVGNHEADNGPDGEIANMAACLQDRMGSHGQYGRQYAFTYPTTNPLAKIIMISPRITAEGHTYDYARGSKDRRWLVRKINGARAAGIPWVIVGMHYPCLSSGAGHPGCDSGPEVTNLLLRRKVDLVLTGHNHVYQRSAQLGLSRECRRIVPGTYDHDCVTDRGRDDSYVAGRGTVQVTSGRVGGRYQGLNPKDPEHRYFVRSGGDTTGWTRFRVTPNALRAQYVSTSGDTTDAFSIRR